MSVMMFDFSPRPTTQKGRILTALQAAGPRGVCLADLDRDDSYTARNRVAELRAAAAPQENTDG